MMMFMYAGREPIIAAGCVPVNRSVYYRGLRSDTGPVGSGMLIRAGYCLAAMWR